ncbi:hypothetical protein HZA56_20085 [Candidatus Poribacteria bacterium]|nr:hypothetical protein [Candidatus Poribacteria bacterium]
MKDHNETPRVPPFLIWLVLALGSILGILLILHHAAHTPTYTIDSYFYLSKAKELAEGHGLRTSWNDGLDTKYFPGYSIFLAIPFMSGLSYISLQMISYLLCVLFMLRVAAALDFDWPAQALAATAFAINPIVIKWFSLPMAEGVALALSLLSVNLAFRFKQAGGYSYLFAASAVGGMAVLTRIEALFLLAVFAAIFFPARKSLSWLHLLIGVVVFLLPLFAYWASLAVAANQSPAYLGEFRGTFLRVGLIKNFIYNVWVPFGFMHRPVKSLQEIEFMSPMAIMGAVWLLVGGVIFLEGLFCATLGWLGQRARGLGFLFLAYASLHSLWYYRYERFMLMAVPLAAIVWVEQLRALALLTVRKGVGPANPLSSENRGHDATPEKWGHDATPEKWGHDAAPEKWGHDATPEKWGHDAASCPHFSGVALMLLAQALLAAGGLYFGNLYGARHAQALQEDTAWLSFSDIAQSVNALNSASHAPVLTDLGPHLAYYVDAHTYLDTEHGNYWHRAFPPERTLEEMNGLGVRFVVTRKRLDKWLEEHHIPPEARQRLEVVNAAASDVSIIKYSP